MRSTHHIIRGLSLGLGLSLLLVSGTVLLIGLFSGPVPSSSALQAQASATTAVAAQTLPAGDRLLYERVLRSDGSRQWALIAEPERSLTKHSGADTLAGISTSPSKPLALEKVSYALLAKPSGLNKAVKICSSSGAGTGPKASDAYDIRCNTLS